MKKRIRNICMDKDRKDRRKRRYESKYYGQITYIQSAYQHQHYIRNQLYFLRIILEYKEHFIATLPKHHMNICTCMYKYIIDTCIFIIRVQRIHKIHRYILYIDRLYIDTYYTLI